MTQTVEETMAAKTSGPPARSIGSRLKDELTKPGLIVAVTEVGSNHFRANWFKYEGFAARVVASKFVRVVDANGTLVITDQSK
jgi:hypothetical protein